MNYNLILYILMLLGFVNGLIVSVYIFIKAESNAFLKLAALVVFLFALTILREFLHVFGEEIELTIFIEQFLYFKLLAVGIILFGYDNTLSKVPNKKLYYLIPGIIEVLFLSAITHKLIILPDLLQDASFVLVDCISFFWILYAYFHRRSEEKQHHNNLKFLYFFVLGFSLIFLTRVVQYLAVLLESRWLYTFDFLFRIIAIGIIIYTLSIRLIIAHVRNRTKTSSNKSNVKPGSEHLLSLIREDQKYLTQNITLEKLAFFYGVDSKTLSATIKEHNKSNFNDYINSLRLEHFMFLIENLEHEKYTLLALAEKSGFNSKATFNRVFKKRYLVSPSTYIKQHS
ncbi:MAG: helix-turn-helix transcriptional regulator [Flavobacteriaceae bacterium]|nr:helix-turn-helix transcriptional regulator [Flavobacteriaceae bacterium]